MAEGLHALMTRAALADFKKALRRQLPELRSAHADEVIAAGFGYRTHAALLAAFIEADELSAVLDLDRARLRLGDFCPDAAADRLGAAVNEFVRANLFVITGAQFRRMTAEIANDN